MGSDLGAQVAKRLCPAPQQEVRKAPAARLRTADILRRVKEIASGRWPELIRRG